MVQLKQAIIIRPRSFPARWGLIASSGRCCFGGAVVFLTAGKLLVSNFSRPKRCLAAIGRVCLISAFLGWGKAMVAPSEGNLGHPLLILAVGSRSRAITALFDPLAMES